jgi:hypothetical protein
MNVASRATPEKVGFVPAAIPATWVPWKQSEMLDGQFKPEPGPVEELTPPAQRLVVDEVFDE